MAGTIYPRVHLNSRLFPFLTGLLVLLQLLVPFQGWMILLVVLGGVWLLAYLWSRSLARGLRLTREMRFGWTQVGDRIEERFTLSNTSILPALWVEIVDHSTLPGYQASRATGVDEQSENCWSVQGICSRRGSYTLGPTELRTGDPFGVYTISLDYPVATTMLVMPPVVPLPDIQIAPGGRAGEGRRRVESWERTVNAAGVRDYFPGDSLSWVHWRSTAHRDELSVRLFDSTPTSDWWIFLDLNQPVQIEQGQHSTLEHGVILAASLADLGLRSGRAVGLVALGKDSVWLPPRQGEPQRWQILRELALVSAGSHSLQDVLSRAKPAFKQRSSIIVITPDIRGDWIQSLFSFLRGGVIPTILLFDPGSFGGAGDARGAMGLLTELEIAHHLITRDVLDRPEANPGRAGYWEWHASPLGKAVAIHKPRDMRWKALA